MSVFPSLPPPQYSWRKEDKSSLLDSEAAVAKAKQLEQWVGRTIIHSTTKVVLPQTVFVSSQKESLHRSPHSTPLGLTKEDCEAVLEEGEEGEEGEADSAELESDASFESTMYEDDDG